MPKPIDYLMDPQPWNPVCNRVLVKMNETAKEIGKTAEVSEAYDTYNEENNRSKDKLERKLKAIFGANWNDIIAEQ